MTGLIRRLADVFHADKADLEHGSKAPDRDGGAEPSLKAMRIQIAAVAATRQQLADHTARIRQQIRTVETLTAQALNTDQHDLARNLAAYKLALDDQDDQLTQDLAALSLQEEQLAVEATRVQASANNDNTDDHLDQMVAESVRFSDDLHARERSAEQILNLDDEGKKALVSSGDEARIERELDRIRYHVDTRYEQPPTATSMIQDSIV